MIFYENFQSPASGEGFEYQLLINSKKEISNDLLEFGFSSGESPVFSFKIKNGKLYDNDGNFVHHFNFYEDSNLELYGNSFSDCHNYSINRIPINTNCSKSQGNYIDAFFYNNENMEYLLRCNDSLDNDSINSSY